MSMGPDMGRGVSAPGRIAARTGTNNGNGNGEGKGKPATLEGAPLPASISALPAAGVKASPARFAKPAAAPVSVPLHSGPVGTNVEPLRTQLLLPWTWRPLVQASSG